MMRGLVVLLLLNVVPALLWGEDGARYLEEERKALDDAARTEVLRSALADSGTRRLAKFSSLENTRAMAEEAIESMQSLADRASVREVIAEWQAVLARDSELRNLQKRWEAMLRRLDDRAADYRRQAVEARARWLQTEIASFRAKLAAPSPMSEIP